MPLWSGLRYSLMMSTHSLQVQVRTPVGNKQCTPYKASLVCLQGFIFTLTLKCIFFLGYLSGLFCTFEMRGGISNKQKEFAGSILRNYLSYWEKWRSSTLKAYTLWKCHFSISGVGNWILMESFPSRTGQLWWVGVKCLMSRDIAKGACCNSQSTTPWS